MRNGAAPQLQVRPSTQLQLTPQLQQALRLLQLSTLELEEDVQQQLLDNPFLELADAADADNSASTTENIAASADKESVSEENHSETQVESAPEAIELEAPTWAESDFADSSDPSDPSEAALPAERTSMAADDGPATALELASAHTSLAAHLHTQALALRLNPAEQAALYFLIENLSDNGYLEDNLPTLVAALLPGADVDADLDAADTTSPAAQLHHHLQVALALLQHMEPAGVGARDLAECLRLQLRDLPASAERDLAAQLCAQPLALLARKDLRSLARLCSAPAAQVEAALRLLSQLDPKPGRRFAPVVQYSMVPDVLVRRGSQGWRVTLNPAAVPRLQVHEHYAQVLRGQRNHPSHAGLHAQLQAARGYVKHVGSRFDTILRVAQAIVQQQHGFFQHGPQALRPMVLRDVAQQLELHESTISRASNGKFMATPHGTFELNYFFSSGLATDTGGSTSSTAVQAVIAQLIAAENRQKPLSDAKIADLLAEQGIECARRTVAKYREGLGIAVASLRKSL